MRAVNNCQFFGKPLGKFEEVFYNHIYGRYLSASPELFLRALSLAGTDLEREIFMGSVNYNGESVDIKGPISWVSLLSAVTINGGSDGIKEANTFNELLALVKDIDSTHLMIKDLTPLHLNTMLEQPEMIKALFANGASPTVEVNLPSDIDGSEEGYAVWQLNI